MVKFTNMEAKYIKKLIKKIGFRVGSGWDLRTQTEPKFYIGFSGCSGSQVRVFCCFRFGFGRVGRLGRVLLTPSLLSQMDDYCHSEFYITTEPPQQ